MSQSETAAAAPPAETPDSSGDSVGLKRNNATEPEGAGGDGQDASSSNAGPSVKRARRTCPYLGTINKHMLDFDFEKVCSICLSNQHVYACLVCGRYFQGKWNKARDLSWTTSRSVMVHKFNATCLDGDAIHCLQAAGRQHLPLCTPWSSGTSCMST